MKLPALKEIIEERKEKAIDDLSTSFAKNRLPLEEYERLVEYINKIESERELVVVEKIVAEYGNDGNETPAGPYRDDDDAEDYYQDHGYNSGLNTSLAVLSNRNISGPVKSGAQFVSILASTEIKIRKADLGKRRTVLNIVSILGDATIFVEPGIRVTNKAIPILGSAETNQKIKKMANNADPELIVSGAAFLGSITVKLLKD